MKQILISLILVFLIASDCNAVEEWTTEQKILQSVFTGLAVIDWMQTIQIAKHPKDFHEHNPILGQHPSMFAVNTYFPIAIVGNALISHYLNKDRNVWQISWIILESGTVISNFSIGLTGVWK